LHPAKAKSGEAAGASVNAILRVSPALSFDAFDALDALDAPDSSLSVALPCEVPTAFRLGEDRRLWLACDGTAWWTLDPRDETPVWTQADTNEVPSRFEDDPAWDLVGRLPASNHDLSGDVLGNHFYMAGGLTAEFGFPAKDHAFSSLFAFDLRRETWRVAVDLGMPRVYCGTSHLNGEVWIVGGDTSVNDEMVPTDRVQIFNPADNRLRDGPALPVAMPMPLALHANGRLYVIGSEASDPRRVGKVFSIGKGEATWRAEPDGPEGMGPLAGCALKGNLFVTVPEKSIAVYSVKDQLWETHVPPMPPRSPQVAALHDEIWFMGGRNVPGNRSVQIFDPKKKRWRRGPDLPRPLAWGAGFSSGQDLYVAGGAAGACYSDLTFRLKRAVPEKSKTDQAATWPAWDGSKLMGRSAPAYPYDTEDVFPKLRFKRMVAMRPLPRTSDSEDPSRLVVAELPGEIRSFIPDADVSRADLMLTLAPKRKIYGLEFHPDYPSTPHVFIFSNVSKPPRTNVVSRFSVIQSDPPVIDPDSEVEVLRWWSQGHDGGDLHFGPDGMLYLASGDGQVPDDPAHSGQDTDNLLGSILRIDVSTLPYRVPPDNPFVGVEGIRPEVWCYGHRNPWRMSFDAEGNLWVGDNGNELWESIYQCHPKDNHGWSTFEGSHPYRPEEGLRGPTKELAPPISEHSHQDMRSVVGGIVCRDPALPELVGAYIYGDYITGKIWSLRWKGRELESREPIADLRAQLLAFAETEEGSLLMLRNDGTFARLRQREQGTESLSEKSRFPEHLSQTGLFVGLGENEAGASEPIALAPATGVDRYAIRHPQWADGETSRYHVALSSGRFANDDGRKNRSWELPVGGVVAKTLFSTNGMPVETQVILNDSKIIYPYSYAWNETGSDATLVPAEGATIRGRRFSGRSECMVCHHAASPHLLGFHTAQLNRDGQLERWAERGWHRNKRMRRPNLYAQWPVATPPRDASQLDSWARTYLHVNCAHCHRTGGAGGRGDFQLLASMGIHELGVFQPAKLDLWQMKDPQLIAPKHPDRSMVLKRCSVRGAGQMPLFGSSKVDEVAVSALREWIQTMRKQ